MARKKSTFKNPKRQGPMTRMKPKAARVRHEPSSVPNAAGEGIASDSDYEMRPLGRDKNRIRLGPSVEAEIGTRIPRTVPEPPIVPREMTVQFPSDISSPSGGKSPAADFAAALMQGNQNAIDLVSDITQQRAREDWERDRDKPALADMFVAETYTLGKRLGLDAHGIKLIEPILQTYRQDIKKANRFVLDNDFVRYITEVSSTISPEKLLARIQYATLPYDLTWVEFDLRAKVRTMRAIHGMDDSRFDYGDVAERLGLIMRRLSRTTMTVEMVCETFGEHGLIGTTIAYFFSVDEHDWKFSEKHHGCTTVNLPDVAGDPSAIDRLATIGNGSLWGYQNTGAPTMIQKAEEMRKIGLPIFLARHGQLGTGRMKEILFQFIGMQKINDRAVLDTISSLMFNETVEFTGMMRWVVCVLAALNEVPTAMRHVEQKGTIRTGLTMRRPLMDHHVVTLRVPKSKPAVPWIENQFKISVRRRAHMVRSHWRTYVYEKDNCAREHEWQYDYEEGFAVCGRCTAYRRLIEEHQRGDETLGWVNKSYIVKPEKQP